MTHCGSAQADRSWLRLIDVDGNEIAPKLSGECGSAPLSQHTGRCSRRDGMVWRLASVPCSPEQGTGVIAGQNRVRIAAKQGAPRPAPGERQAGVPLDLLKASLFQTSLVIPARNEQKEILLSHSTAIG